MTLRRALPLCAVLVLAACGGDDASAGTIPREKFVAANVALRSVADSATPAQRAAVLRKHGVTEAQLKAFVTEHARQPEELAKAWEQIAFRLDSLGGEPPPTPVIPVPAGVPPARPQTVPPHAQTPQAVPPPPPSVTVEPRPSGGARRRPVKQVQ
jgi:hypothetical protein